MKHARSCVLVAAAALALTACSSSNSSQKAAESQLGAIQSAVAQGATAASAGPTSSDGAASSQSSASGAASASGSGTDPASIDVCALLTAADVNAVAQTDKLDDAQTASTVYTLTATKMAGVDGDSVCSFDIEDPAAFRREGTIEFYVSGPSEMSDHSDGTKVSGLGDEALTFGQNDFAVRVGGLVLVAENGDTFSAAIIMDLLRKMIPRLP
jgi:hypothetical protein